MCIILTGMMGSGKSKIGKELSSMLSLPFIDLDRLIEDYFSLPVNAVFSKYGEAAFREREAEIMVGLAQQNQEAVLALGGGSILAQRGMEALKAQGKVVYLRTSVPVLAARLSRSRHTRPLLAESNDIAATLREILALRKHLYEEYADLVVDTDDKTPQQVAHYIAVWWKEGKSEL